MKHKGFHVFNLEQLDHMIIGSRQYSDQFNRLKLPGQALYDDNKDQI